MINKCIIKLMVQTKNFNRIKTKELNETYYKTTKGFSMDFLQGSEIQRLDSENSWENFWEVN